MTTIALILAAFLAWFVGTAHSWLGERRLLGPLLAERAGMLGRSKFAARTLRGAWHLTTLAWWGLGATLATVALAPPASQVHGALVAMAITFLVTGAVIAISSRGRHFAWPIFVAIAGLSLAPLL